MLQRFIVVLIFLISFQNIKAQTNITEQLSIFLDCRVCDNEYLRQNLGNVQFVRDQFLGDVHVFFVTQRNGSGGRSYEVEFIGKKEFEAINYKLTFSTDANMTRDETRQRVLENLKLGLVRFWIAKGTTDEVTVSVPAPEDEEEVKEDDPWNYWLFQIGAGGFFDGQEQSRFSNINFNASARRVTEKNKFSFRARFSESRNVFEFEGDEIIGINDRKSINVSDILSINDHWSYGFFGFIGSSTFNNTDLQWTFRPALEYSFFNYVESAKKQLTISYRNGIRYNDYIERTLFNETEEYLWEHGVQVGGRINQEWGNFNAEVSFNQFLNDTSLYALNFFVGTRIRLFKGFNFNVSGSYSITRNQINLPGGDLSLEELLLQQQQLQSGYNYFVNVGFSYSFGSIYNTIVNPRFDF
ncbi:hypothetical protein [Winogradskyella vincentii]|uniref:DUF481 domain-containing protein n=1 Tax=Winogradskyella vincentii TaxID=2877122 RepID=A0ABS7XXY8_9FLAO|nr:hypothetical protein [Winogradskyella vincentii]MCA0152528.1 hypothetical protein [Winogradskyella vincentii]